MKDGLVKPEDMPRFSATIYDEARRLISMIEGIIKLSRLDENRVELDWKDVDLYELAFSIKNDLKRRSEEESVTIHIRRSEELHRSFTKCFLIYVKMRLNTIIQEEKSYSQFPKWASIQQLS